MCGTIFLMPSQIKTLHFGKLHWHATGGTDKKTCTKLTILIQGLASQFTSYLGSTNTSVTHRETLKSIKEIA